MGRYKCLFGVILALVMAVAPFGAYAYPKSRVIYSENFEDRNVGDSLTNIGWIKDNAGTGQYTVEEDPKDKNNLCAYITMTSSSGELYIRKNVGSGVSETFVTEFDIYIDSNGSLATFTVLGNTEEGKTNSSLINLTFNKNGFIYLNDSQISKYVMKKWYKIKVEADVQNDLCNIYINGVYMAREKNFINSANATEITRVRFNPFRNDVGFYFDNFVMSSSFEPIRSQIDDDYSDIKINNGMIDVKDFGAIPDDDKDDSTAVYRAISAAIKNGPGIGVKFDSGKYRFESGYIGDYKRIISINGAEDLKLSGSNTEFIICDPFLGGIRVAESKNIEISGISIDYSEVPWTQGIAEKIDKENGYFDYRVEEGYSKILNDPRMEAYKGFAMILDKDNHSLLKKSANDHFNVESWEQLEDNLFRMYPSENYKGIVKTQLEEGDPVTLNVRTVEGSAFMFVKDENCSVKNCNVYASNNCIFVATYLKGKTKIDNLKAAKRENSDRWIVSNADGVHVQGSRGPVEVTNCTFEGISDDCVNIYNKPAYISAVESDRVIVVKHEAQVPLEGETIRVFDIITGKIRGESKIIKSESVEGTTPNLTAKLTLEIPVSGMKAGGSYKTGDEVFSLESQAPGSVIKETRFADSRRFGCYLKSVDTVVEDCVFENLGGSAFFIENDLSVYWEGPTAKNAEIKNNVISNTPYRDEYKLKETGAAIIILANKLSGVADAPVHENITFTGNKINSAGRMVMYAGNVKNLSFNNNIINIEKQEIADSSIGTVKIVDSDGVSISENQISDERSGLKYAFSIDDYSENVKIENNSLNIPEKAEELIEGTSIDILIPKSKTDISVDGNLDDWKDAFEFKVNSLSYVKQFNDGWSEKDLGYEGKLLWDEKYLYVAVKAKDDIHSQRFAGSDIWQGDSVQIAVDPDRSLRPGYFGYTEMIFALNDNGESVKAAFTSLENKADKNGDTVLYKSLRNNNDKTTVYEIALPWSNLLLNADKAHFGKIIGFSALVNDNDGDLRKGWMEYFGGIGSGKRPDNYGVAMLCENNGDAVKTVSFSDISGIKEEKDIKKLIKKNIISGYGDDRFRPDDIISKAEFLSMLMKAAKIQAASYNGGLSDVKGGDWFADIIQGAFDFGIIDMNMISNGKIAPEGELKLGEACALLCRAFKFDYSNGYGKWQTPYVEACLKSDIISSETEDDLPCSRKTAAKMICKAIEISEEAK